MLSIKRVADRHGPPWERADAGSSKKGSDPKNTGATTDSSHRDVALAAQAGCSRPGSRQKERSLGRDSRRRCDCVRPGADSGVAAALAHLQLGRQQRLGVCFELVEKGRKGLEFGLGQAGDDGVVLIDGQLHQPLEHLAPGLGGGNEHAAFAAAGLADQQSAPTTRASSAEG